MKTMEKKEKTIDPQFSEVRTGLPGKSCPQQESVRKDGKDLSKPLFNWKAVCFLCFLGFIMIVFLGVLIFGNYIASHFQFTEPGCPPDQRMGVIRGDNTNWKIHVGHHQFEHGLEEARNKE